MTEREAELLEALLQFPDGTTPLRVGGSGHNHVSKTLRRMVPKGWVERSFGLGFGVPKNYKARGSCRYRITVKGRIALSNHLVTKARLSELLEAVGGS